MTASLAGLLISLGGSLLAGCEVETPAKEPSDANDAPVPDDDNGDADDGEPASSFGTEVGVQSSKVLTPNYDDLGDSDYESSASAVKDLTGDVAARQAGGLVGNVFGGILGGTMTLAGGQKVAVQANFSAVECPEGLDGCNTISSDKLGVAKSALVASLSFLKRRIGVQGERATCAAFVVNDAVEILLDREGISVDLSEQNTYFAGKRATNSWNNEGVVPGAFLRGIVDKREGLVAESAWPYNIERGDCAAYQQEHKGATCSKTEAQGGGDQHKDQDPKAAKAKIRYVIDEAHQLYASVGRVKQALHQGFPVLLSFQANKDFQAATNKGGVVAWNAKEVACGSQSCGHATLAVGYVDDEKVGGGGYVIIKNSWDKTWGQDGFGFLTYEWLKNSIIDAQAIVRASKR